MATSTATKSSVEALKHKTEALRQQLVTHWDEALDEDGNFQHTFGDPAGTPCAITVWVGYDDNEETSIKFTYPVDSSSEPMPGDGLSDYHLETLELLIIDNAELLDSRVYDFANAITNFLQAIEDHPSFRDEKRLAWLASKVKLEKEAALYKSINYKASKEGHEAAEAERIAKRREKDRLAYLQMQEWARQRLIMKKNARQQKSAHSHMELLRKEQEAAALENYEADADRRATIYAFNERVRGLVPNFNTVLRRNANSNSYFHQYLENVVANESQYVLSSAKSISEIYNYMQLLTHVTEVNLSHNLLDTLPSNFFSMPSLQRLYLGSNQLKSLPPIGKATSLQILDLHMNELEELPTGFENLTDLRTLDLERNKIRSISGPTFNTLLRLDFLNLSNNLIRIVPPELGFLEKLNYVQLKHNPVTNLPPNVYLQGTAASLEFLRKISSVDIHPSSLVADLTRLMPSFPCDRAHLASHPANFLCNLILRAGKPASPVDCMRVDDVPVVIPQDADNEIFEHPVHDYFVAARSSYLATLLKEASSSKIPLPIDERTQLPVLALPVTPKQLSVVVRHLYTDSYKPVKQIIMAIPDHLPQEAKDAIAGHNKKLSEAWSLAFDRILKAASLFQLPYLAMLVSRNSSTVPAHNSLLLMDMALLYKERSVSGDLTFKFRGSAPIRAHKALLCARSQYFNMLLTGGLAESQGNVITIDENPAIFEQIIAFCYLDDVTELESDTIIDLMATANRYNLDRLVQIVANVIGYSLDADNVTGILTSAKHYSVKALAKACYFYLLSHWSAVRKTSGWRDLPQNLRTKILARAAEWGIAV